MKKKKALKNRKASRGLKKITAKSKSSKGPRLKPKKKNLRDFGGIEIKDINEFIVEVHGFLTDPCHC